MDQVSIDVSNPKSENLFVCVITTVTIEQTWIFGDLHRIVHWRCFVWTHNHIIDKSLPMPSYIVYTILYTIINNNYSILHDKSQPMPFCIAYIIIYIYNYE